MNRGCQMVADQSLGLCDQVLFVDPTLLPQLAHVQNGGLIRLTLRTLRT